MDPNEIHTVHASTAPESHLLFGWAEELLPLKVLYWCFNQEKTSALQLIFLTESNSRKLTLRLSLGVCSVFWKDVYVEPEMNRAFQDCN